MWHYDEFFSRGTLNVNFSGSTSLTNNSAGANTILTQDNGNTFSIFSIDLAEHLASAATVTFIGALTGGGTTTQSFTLDGINTTGASAETFLFNASFTGLYSLSWSQIDPFHQFDNLVIGLVVIPLPPALPLFLTGLAGLALISRRQRQVLPGLKPRAGHLSRPSPTRSSV